MDAGGERGSRRSERRGRDQSGGDAEPPGGDLRADLFAGVFRSTDGGATFSKPEPGGSGTRYAALALDPANAQTIFVSANETQGGPGGLFKSTDDGQSWANVGLGTVPVSSVAVAPDGTIYAGTIGQGVWRFGVP